MRMTCSEPGLLVRGTRPALLATLGSRGLPHLNIIITVMRMMMMMMKIMIMMMMMVMMTISNLSSVRI